MFHSLIGNVGHFSVILSFVTAILASFGYVTSTLSAVNEQKSWILFSRSTFYLHAISVFTIAGTLFVIIYNHYYEYYYAWSHSSNILPTHYMISCFWEGQEGSFLLWMFWHAVLGLILMNTQKKWEAPMMAVFTLVQAFLASMILGVVIGEIKLGSSPFILMREFMPEAPIFTSNPEFVPKDGTGLNPLLQNYWMVIHPPTLFLGFATTLVPFSFCIAGLYQKQYSEWIKPAFPWALFSALILGIGILMGGYWAYETLNFGGYWNWDPVENAVYVPWLILIASIHGMVIYKKNNTALKTAIILSISTFLLILYSTFLTRSGILGNASVHSFTDLGLSSQLLVYLITFIVLAIALLIYCWKKIPTESETLSVFNADFWIFLGILTLCLSAFQIIATTSIPVYNTILNNLGYTSKIALPADQVAHYSKFQIWFSIAIALLSGTGPLFFWKKLDLKSIQKVIYTPLVITLALTTCIIYFSNINRIDYIILLLTSIFAFVSNIILLIPRIKSASQTLGGGLAHIGIALMLIGVLFSAGYSKIISKNTSGLLYSKEFSTEMNQDNVLLFRNQEIQMNPFKVTYKGPRIEVAGVPGYINKEKLYLSESPYKAILTEDVIVNGKKYYAKNDTITYMEENTFFEVEFKKEDGATFTLYPRAQVNKEMGLLASPDIKKLIVKDIYTHVSSIPDPNDEKDWSEIEMKQISIGDTFLINDYYAILEEVKKVDEIQGIALSGQDAAIKASIKVLDNNLQHILEPIFIIHNQMIGRIPDQNMGIGSRITLVNIEPKSSMFTFGIQTTQKDWIILKTMEKPFIDILWFGSILTMFGMAFAIRRRYIEFQKKDD
ncbi:MAG: cytochrome c biogenesis protein CcsA [Bacteroidota bacterium]|nr:cytochrome c biogenesis protein CcsA [Bacteroidota bacterium]